MIYIILLLEVGGADGASTTTRCCIYLYLSSLPTELLSLSYHNKYNFNAIYYIYIYIIYLYICLILNCKSIILFYVVL